jgi:hypothetical protein
MKKQRPGDPPEAASQTLMTKKLELRAWCFVHTAVMPALKRQRQKNHKFHQLGLHSETCL